MEENKPVRSFSSLNAPPNVRIEKSPERRTSKRETTTKPRQGKTYNESDVNVIPVYKNSHIIISKEVPINIESTLQIKRVLEIDKEYPNQIFGFNPPLFKEFITEDNTITTIVKIGDTVKLKDVYKDKVNKPRKVKDLYFRALNNFTVIVALLEDDDFYVAYYLEKV